MTKVTGLRDRKTFLVKHIDTAREARCASLLLFRHIDRHITNVTHKYQVSENVRRESIMNIWGITLKAMQDTPAKEYGDIVRMQYDIPSDTEDTEKISLRDVKENDISDMIRR